MGIGHPSEGRVGRGFRLVRESLVFLRERPRMLVLPVVSGIAVTISALLVFTAAISLDDGSGWGFAMVALLGTLPLSVVATFFNVAFLAMAVDVANGYEPTVAGGLRVAEERLGPIVAWSILSTGVGVLLAAIQQIPGVGGWLGRLVAAAGSLAWGLATFFVLPIITLHGTGARESVKRSAETIRARWGETVTGDLAIGALMTLALLPAAIVLGVGLAFWSNGDEAVGAPLIAAGVLVVACAFTLSGALTSLFQLFLYRHVALGTSDGPFAVDDLERAVKPKQRRKWWPFGH